MYIKNLLKSGTYFIPVPMGIPLTLQYSAIGRLQKVSIGHTLDNSKDISARLLAPFITTPIVPTEIPIKSGTTWIRGILHTNTIYSINGKLPDCLYDVMIEDYLDNPQDFNFYAITMDSVGTSFRSPVNNRQWLVTAKFDALRGWTVPQGIDDKSFHHLLTTGKFGFNQSYICEYVIYEGESYDYHMIDVSQYVISSIKTRLNQSGWLIAEVFTKSNNDEELVLSTHYSNIIKNRLDKGTLLVMDGIEIAGLLNDNVMPKRLITCPICGKQYAANVTGVTQCDDPHCMSIQYNTIAHMLSKFNLPVISWDKYWELISNHTLLSITDIFELPEYWDVKIATKFSTVLAAIVPLTVVPDSKLFDVFCGNCRNEIKTIRYYMDNPDRISTDLHIVSPLLPRFVEWLEDPANLLLFDTILDLPQISIALKSKKFEGLPILRDKVFYLNGDFKHGSYQDVVALLESFSATVSPEYNQSVNCVVIGDLHQNIKGKVIKEATYNHIQILEEQQLFKMYSLDEDIKANLGEESV